MFKVLLIVAFMRAFLYFSIYIPIIIHVLERKVNVHFCMMWLGREGEWGALVRWGGEVCTCCTNFVIMHIIHLIKFISICNYR